MYLPHSYNTYSSSKVCILNMSLYGLKQYNCQRYSKVSSVFISLGYKASQVDYSLYVKSMLMILC